MRSINFGTALLLLVFILAGCIATLFINREMVFELLTRQNIPRNFILEENIYFKEDLNFRYRWALICKLAAYKIKSFDNSPKLLEGTEYQGFLKGKDLNRFLDEDIDPRLQVGNTAAFGKRCAVEQGIRREYLETLDSPTSYFSFSRNGSTLLAYNPQTKILYIAAGD